MRHEGPLPPDPEVCVDEVSYDVVDDLRVVWHHEDLPDLQTVNRAESKLKLQHKGSELMSDHEEKRELVRVR